MTGLELSVAAANPLARTAKHAFDLLLSIFLLAALAPLWVLIPLWIRLDSPGPVIFRQPRIGFGGRRFTMLKFRTMAAGAEEDLQLYLNGSPRARLTWEQYQKLRDDPRLTRCGRFLRRLSLDELPQLWNVMRGEMSLVGPRPILPEQQEIYGPQICFYQKVRPGMTGLWQVNGRSRTSFAERVEWDARYLCSWSLLLDLRILARTLGVVLRGEGV